jgi:exodeoxyribonuclease VII large subunit
MERYASALPSLKDTFRQTVFFMLQQKEQHLDYLQKKLQMSDPRLQCRTGWAQVSKQGKPAALDTIEKDESFILEDAQTKIEAVCISKMLLIPL